MRCLHGQLAVAHELVEQDLDVDLVVAAVDAGGVVDRVGVDEPAVDRVLDTGELGEAEVAAFADDPGPEFVPVDAQRVVGPVADVGVALDRRLHVGADAAVPEQIDRGAQDRRDEVVGPQLGHRRLDAEHIAHLGRERDRLELAGVHAAAGRDQTLGRSRPSSNAAARTGAGARRVRRRVGIGVEEHVAMIERRHEPQVRRQQHAVAEDVARHVADADHGEFVGVDVLADHTCVSAHALPRTTRRDPHLLVVVAVAPPRGERIAEPEVVLGGDLVGDVAERRRALVGGHDEVRVVGIVDHDVGRVHDRGPRRRCRSRPAARGRTGGTGRSLPLGLHRGRRGRLRDDLITKPPFAPVGTMTAFLTIWALTRPSTSVRKSSGRSLQRSPPRAMRPPRRCTPSTNGEHTKISNSGRGSGQEPDGMRSELDGDLLATSGMRWSGRSRRSTSGTPDRSGRRRATARRRGARAVRHDSARSPAERSAATSDRSGADRTGCRTVRRACGRCRGDERSPARRSSR